MVSLPTPLWAQQKNSIYSGIIPTLVQPLLLSSSLSPLYHSIECHRNPPCSSLHCYPNATLDLPSCHASHELESREVVLHQDRSPSRHHQHLNISTSSKMSNTQSPCFVFGVHELHGNGGSPRWQEGAREDGAEVAVVEGEEKELVARRRRE